MSATTSELGGLIILRSDVSQVSQLLLDGVRVLDLTMAHASPIGARILADMGAGVTKAESIQCIDMLTRRIGYPKNEPGVALGIFMAVNRLR